MYPDVNNSTPDDAMRSGWRAALGIKLAMLGVLLLVAQANFGFPAANVTSDGSVPTALLVLSKGI